MGSYSAKASKAQQANDQTYLDYFKRLRLLALSMFEWENLPDSVSQRFLEQTLFEMGKAIWVYDPSLGHLGLRVTPAGNLNVYGDPVKFQAYSIGYSKFYDADQCVMIRNNYDMLPTVSTLSLFAQRLTEVERTLDVNIKALKTPVLVLCEDRQRLTLKNLYHQVDGNEPVIYADKSLNPDAIKVLRTDAPFLADKLMLYKHDLWNDALTFLGINNANTDKKERLITDEATANDQMIELSAQTMLLTRQKACDEINDMFGLNVSVKLRSYQEVQSLDPEEPEPEESEEVEA